MIRTNIHFTEPQLKQLQQLADKSGMAVAEIVRRAIDEYLERHKSGK